MISFKANIVDLRLNLILLEERRAMATLTEATYKKKLEKYYNAKVGKKNFMSSELVLRSNEASNHIPKGKLAQSGREPTRS